MIRVAVDAMGGDQGPEAMVQGACEASERTEAEIILVGDEALLTGLLAARRHDHGRVRIEPASGVIPMDASPRAAIEALPEASLPVAARLVGAGGADALVSAGNTGAVILSCANAFRRIEGVQRTALAAVVPTERRHGSKGDPFTLLLDVGATVRVRAEDLVSFALMGAAYSGVIGKNARPRVALLSNGSEPNKGTDEIVAAHAKLALDAGRGAFEFIGNVEGVDLPRGTADVIVCDGFTGNVVLKMFEGVSETVVGLAKFAAKSRLSWRLALMLLASGIRQIKTVTDWQQYGGAPILGFDRICIKAHGRSGPRAIRNAIKVAARCVEQDLAGQIRVRASP